MTKKSVNKKSRIEVREEPLVEFVATTKLTPGTAVTHKGVTDKIKRSVAQMGEDFELVLRQMSSVIEIAERQARLAAGNYQLEEISLGLAFDASGKISFIAGAEAGVEASVQVTFKRKAE
jgi:hypothetical protein